MIEFEHTKVFNFDGAFRGMRNPLDSWNKSDSRWGLDDNSEPLYILGENDLKLAQSLIKGGSEHRKFMRQILVSVDITAPRYWWVDFDTYSVGVTKNSCSTNHKILSYSFEPQMFEIDYDIEEEDEEFIKLMLRYLELKRLKSLAANTKEEKEKQFRRIKQMLPEGFLQKRTVTLNYENIFNIIKQRENHKLIEFREDFINWSKSLPYSEELIFVGK